METQPTKTRDIKDENITTAADKIKDFGEFKDTNELQKTTNLIEPTTNLMNQDNKINELKEISDNGLLESDEIPDIDMQPDDIKDEKAHLIPEAPQKRKRKTNYNKYIINYSSLKRYFTGKGLAVGGVGVFIAIDKKIISYLDEVSNRAIESRKKMVRKQHL